MHSICNIGALGIRDHCVLGLAYIRYGCRGNERLPYLGHTICNVAAVRMRDHRILDIAYER